MIDCCQQVCSAQVWFAKHLQHGAHRVKFGAFYEYLDREHGDHFDRIASGHYARVIRGSGVQCQGTADGSVADGDGVTRLALTADAVKDQTYFLAQLTQVMPGTIRSLLCSSRVLAVFCLIMSISPART